MAETVGLAAATLSLAIRLGDRSAEGQLGPHSEWSAKLLPRRGEVFIVREMRRQIESAVERVADELSLIYSSGSESVTHESFDRSIREIAYAFDDSSNRIFSRADVVKKLPGELTSQALPTIEARWMQAGLNGGAINYGISALNICTYALAAWSQIVPARTRESTSHESTWEALIESSTLISTTNGMITEVKRAGVTGTTGFRRIVGVQRRDLSLALNRMELFGLPGDARFRRVPLDVSYLALKFLSARHRPAASSLDKLLDTLAQRVDKRKKRGIRLLITGRAGSGKTTASQWIAYRGSQQRLHSLATPSRHLLPLYVRLREAIGVGSPPSDRALLYSAQLQEDVSANWLESHYLEVTPLILLDGWDELSDVKKSVATEWLKSLALRFPESHIIVTSRPEGIVDNTFIELQFDTLSVAPLTADDSKKLAHKWFQGLHETLRAAGETDLGATTKACEDLIRDLDTPAVSDMADSPLLTSMLCCLYSTNSTAAPDRRGQLYDQVTSVLIDARGRARREQASLWDTYNLLEKEELLKRVAYAMSEYLALQLPIIREPGKLRQSLTDIVAQSLPLLGRSPSEATELCEAMLNRSIVLHRVSGNYFEFVHRSIQDYYTARVFRDSRSMKDIFRHAAKGQWQLLPFAVHQATIEYSDQVVTGLLTLIADCSEKEQQRNLRFVLVECLGAATALSSKVRAAADNDVSLMFPPTTSDDVKALASLGNASLPYLQVARMEPQYYAIAIATISRIGTREAMMILAGYADRAERSTIVALTNAWSRFDPTDYAKTVISKLGPDIDLIIGDNIRVRAAIHLPSVRSLRIEEVALGSIEKRKLQQVHSLRNLSMYKCSEVGDLAWTSKIASLRRLSVQDCRGLSEIGLAGPESLLGLQLESLSAQAINWSKLVPRLTQLQYLSLGQVALDASQFVRPLSAASGQLTETVPANALEGLDRLATFKIGEQMKCESLDFLLGCRSLVGVDLSWYLTSKEVKLLGSISSVRRLRVRVTPRSNARLLAGIDGLQRLRVQGECLELLAAINVCDRLVDLEIEGCSSWPTRNSLTLPPQLRTLALIDCRSADSRDMSGVLQQVGNRSLLEAFSWSGGEIGDFSFLKSMQKLKSLTIRGNESLESLEGIKHVPSGCRVVAVGMKWNEDDNQTVIQLRDRGCDVTYEPDYGLDEDNFFVDLGGS